MGFDQACDAPMQIGLSALISVVLITPRSVTRALP